MLVEGRVERLLRRFARDRWVRLHGTPRVTVLVGARPLVDLYRSWIAFSATPSKLYADRDLDRAVREACAHAVARPGDSVAVHTSTTELTRWRAGRDDRLHAMVDEGLVYDEHGHGGTSAQQRRLNARSAAELALYEALESTPQTAGRFALNECLSVRFGATACEVDLLSRADRIAIEVDGYHHFTRRDAYRRDRRKDLLMQQQGLLVIRVLAADVFADPRPAVRMVVEALATRLASP